MLCVFVAGCGGKYDVKIKSPEEPLIPEDHVPANNPNTYIKVHYPENDDLLKIVKGINLQRVALQNAIEAALPGVNIIPMDAGVDLGKPVSVKASGIIVKDFITQLTGVSDYHYTINNNTLRISSLQTKQWNVAALATKRSGEASVGQKIAGASGGSEEDSGSSSGGSSTETQTKQKFEFTEDTWANLIVSAEKIIGAQNTSSSQGSTQLGVLGASADSNAPAPSQAVKPYLVQSRANGLIMAASSPSRIAKLDEWLSSQVKNSTVQFYLDINAYEVTLNNNRGAGIDWNVLNKGGLFGANNTQATTTINGPSPSLVRNSGVFSLGANVVKENYDANLLVRFLERYGKVSLLTQPNVTLTNGKEAYFSSALEFSYTASVQQSQDQQGNVTVTPELQRVKVGVTISITARLLHNRKIALDVVPVLTAIEGFTDIQAGPNFQARTPNIALKELATQVITEPGKPIRLGGLISERIREDITRVPRDGNNAAFWDFFFKNQVNEIERRELVISITPSILES